MEIERPVAALAFSGLFAGACVGFGAVASAAAATALGGHPGARLVGAMVFPVGFIVVIIGRAQLFAENTLYPVTLVLDERRHLLDAAALDRRPERESDRRGPVCAAADQAAALPPETVAKVAEEGHRATVGHWASFFWSAVLGGWAVALVAWLIQSGGAVIGQIALIWTLVFFVGLLGLDHSVSTTIEVICAALKSEVHLGHGLVWFSAVLLGNIAGGVLITAVLNYGQVRAGEH